MRSPVGRNSDFLKVVPTHGTACPGGSAIPIPSSRDIRYFSGYHRRRLIAVISLVVFLCLVESFEKTIKMEHDKEKSPEGVPEERKHLTLEDA